MEQPTRLQTVLGYTQISFLLHDGLLETALLAVGVPALLFIFTYFTLQVALFALPFRLVLLALRRKRLRRV